MPSKQFEENNKNFNRKGPAGPGETGKLYIVSTPIGNLSDITLRALETLRSVDLIAAEDTRHTRKLLSKYDIHKRLVSYHENNARQRGPDLLEKISAGKSIAVVTDAGTPGISDPGWLLIESALDLGIEPIPIPGPTALISALVVSGLPTHPFCFLGFPPAKGPAKRRFYSSGSSVQMTLILYQSPKKIAATLKDILENWGDRRIAVARELTKIHEEIFRGRVSEALEYFVGELRGEFALVVEGVVKGEGEVRKPGENAAQRDSLPQKGGSGFAGFGAGSGDPGWEEEIRTLIRNGVSSKEAASKIASKFNIPRRVAYKAALNLRKEK